MWPFKSVKSLKDSGLFRDFIDVHSHILPGVDDGIPDVESSIKVLALYESLGVKKVWFTPHIMEDIPNDPEHLKEIFSQLSEKWKGSVEIALAAEHMLDNMFVERLETGRVLPIGQDYQHLLVETSYYTPPMGMDSILDNIKSKGYFPILAHPERYRYMDEDDYRKLKERGVLFQLNFISLVGGFGDTARKKAEWLMSNEMVDMVGSDVHRLERFLKSMEESPRKPNILKTLLEIAHNPKISL